MFGIQSAQTATETKELSHYAIKELVNSNDTATIKTHLPEVLYRANTNSTMVDIYVNALFVGIMQDGEKTDILSPQLITEVKNQNLQSALNNALTFQLADNKNLELDNISENNIKTLKDYIDTQASLDINF